MTFWRGYWALWFTLVAIGLYLEAGAPEGYFTPVGHHRDRDERAEW
jgi:hypothetical protein